MNGIEGFGSMQGMFGVMGGSQQPATLTDDQKQQVQTILSKYDPKNLTAQDAQDIFKQLQQAGIQPGKDLRQTMKSAGFDMHQLRSLVAQANGTDGSTSQGATLTDDQKKQVQSILSQYDPSKLTASDAQSIFKQLQQAGIQPGKDLMNTIQAAGYDTKQLASLAGVGGGGHHHHHGGGQVQSQSQSQGVSTAALQSLQSILGQYDLTNITQDQQKSLMTQLNQAGLLQSGDLINISA